MKLRAIPLVLALAAAVWPIPVRAADIPRDEQPMYGGIAPTTPQKQIDDAYVARAVKLAGSRPKGSDMSARLGFEYLQNRHDPATAMKRFNQAWLVDPDNGAAFHGMALAL